MLAETREEVKEKKREEEEATKITTGVKRDDKKRLVIIPYIRGFSEALKRTFGDTVCQRISSLYIYEHSAPAVSPPERPSGEGQSCGPSVQDKL